MGQSRTGVAQGSALASHYTSALPAPGSRVYAIQGPNNHVNEIAWVVGSGWTATDLLHATGAPSAIAGSALASHDSNGSRVYFIGRDNHVHEIASLPLIDRGGWNTTDLTAGAKDGNGNTPPSPIAGSPLASHDSSGSRVYFIGKDPASDDDHVYEIASGQWGWNYTPLTGVATAAPPPIAGSALASHDSSGSRVYFIGKDPTSGADHVYEIAWAGSWNYTDLTYATTPPNQSWMTDLANSTPGFANFKLSQICFPGTHDAGTYFLSSIYTTNPPLGAYKTALDTLSDIVAKLDVIPSLSQFIDPFAWAKTGLEKTGLEQSVRDLATTTRSDIGQQLNDGIRCLDLRVYYYHADAGNPFYTYHGLVGAPIAPILSEVAYFITDVAPAGEIIYVMMSHYWDDDTPNNRFNSDQLDQLSHLVWSCFPDKSKLFGPGDGPDDGSDLLNYSYARITGSDAGECSKVILVMESVPQTDQSKIWTTDQFNAKFSGTYAGVEDRSQMISDQQNKSVAAKDKSLPFNLSLILTPSNTDTITRLILKSICPAILALVPWIPVAAIPFPFLWPLVVVIVEALLVLALTWGVESLPYTSLQQLSSKIFDSASSTVSALYQNYFQGTEYAAPSIFWMDFYEDHMETRAGRNFAQLVELAKTITLSNK